MLLVVLLCSVVCVCGGLLFCPSVMLAVVGGLSWVVCVFRHVNVGCWCVVFTQPQFQEQRLCHM